MRTLNSLFTAIWLASAAWCHAVVPPVQSVTLAWDDQAASNLTYRVYDNGVITNLVATTTNLSVTLSNVLAAPHRWTVTASNMWGESDPSVPLVVPGAPTPPQNLKPISTTLHGVPVPGMVEESKDLQRWTMRYRIGKTTTNDGIELIEFIIPQQPFGFIRAKTFSAQVPPMP